MTQKIVDEIYATGTIEDCGLIGSKVDAPWAGKWTPLDFYLNEWIPKHYIGLQDVPNIVERLPEGEDYYYTVKEFVDYGNSVVFSS